MKRFKKEYKIYEVDFQAVSLHLLLSISVMSFLR